MRKSRKFEIFVGCASVAAAIIIVMVSGKQDPYKEE